MAVALVRSAQQYNLNSQVSSLVIPFVAATNDMITVHVGVGSTGGTISVASVTDDLGNSYTCKSSIFAVEEQDYSTGGLSKNPIFRRGVQGELWAVKSTGAVTKITVTLSEAANFGVVIQSYTGSNIGVSSSAKQISVSTPVVGLLTTAANSYVCASFHSLSCLAQAASTGTLRAQTEASDEYRGISVVVADNTVAGLATCNVALTPTNTAVISGSTVTLPATYACVALEIKA